DKEEKKKDLYSIVSALGGLNNIKKITSSARWITVVLDDKTKLDSKSLLEDRPYRIIERYYGFVIFCGPASSEICRKIRKQQKDLQVCYKFRKN
ncbi:MAG: hypothetical protein ACI4WG_00970, partial [Erysipelotrichaceae bacterium]